MVLHHYILCSSDTRAKHFQDLPNHHWDMSLTVCGVFLFLKSVPFICGVHTVLLHCTFIVVSCNGDVTSSDSSNSGQGLNTYHTLPGAQHCGEYIGI